MDIKLINSDFYNFFFLLLTPIICSTLIMMTYFAQLGALEISIELKRFIATHMHAF